VPNLGASGAIAGVLGAYILLFPQEKVRVLQGQQVIQVPALIVIGIWIVLRFLAASVPLPTQRRRVASLTWRTSADFWRGLCSHSCFVGIAGRRRRTEWLRWSIIIDESRMLVGVAPVPSARRIYLPLLQW
jgi:hypothetical protein